MGGIGKGLIPAEARFWLETTLPVTSAWIGPVRGPMGSPAVGEPFDQGQRVFLSWNLARLSCRGKRDNGGVDGRTGSSAGPT